MLALAIRSRVARLELREGGSQDSRLHDQAQPGGATFGQQTSFQEISKQGEDPESHANGKGAQQGARSFTPTRAVFTSDGQQEGLDIISVPS